ncbi:hypothetical protein KO507_17060 [Gilvimarinus agarilyticus]|uniref:hypothetical protein n=1 Tax=Gilvimarinus sp. 2_MG-2023 TaxID=3062666 RepID=UPI001C081C83|nr:hypothetical protein [Gilvimarinus sp. 2_MG-2023]MBU2887477.1 hypothetical protein [Gilvimarinus agarilyticus]MDO6572129.1 hypothetical protein [Gilvimarinus sp. 2_MG-2023]
MKYILHLSYSSSTSQTEISEERFEELSQAKRLLVEMLEVEQKYDLLLRNHIRFEKVLYESAMHSMFCMERDWSDFMEYSQAANLELMNLLSMCLTYVDHVPQHLKRATPEGESLKEKFKTKTSKVYDDNLAYRVLSKLRNHAQHFGQPVNSYTVNARWHDDRESSFRAAIPFLTVDELAKNPKFSKKLLKELRALGQQIDLRELVRQNMSGFGVLHKWVRQTTKEMATEARQLIENTIDDYLKEHGEKGPAMLLTKLDAEGNKVEEHQLFKDIGKRYEYLKAKNKTLINVEKHYVTNALEPKR